LPKAALKENPGKTTYEFASKRASLIAALFSSKSFATDFGFKPARVQSRIESYSSVIATVQPFRG